MTGKNATLVLVPGLLSDRTVWDGVIAAMPAGFRVTVADLSTQDSIPAMAADTLAANPGPLMVAGHSMGARVALDMVRQAPDRIVRLALLDTGIHTRTPDEAEKRQVLIELANHEGMAALAARWLPPMVYEARHGDAALMDRLTAMVLRMTPELHARQIRALLERPDAKAALHLIACPVLLAVGRQDQWSPLAQHGEVHRLIPGSQLEVIEHAGHFAPAEQPEQTAAILSRFFFG